ncbi:MAP kinase-activated protein kinase 2 [Dirofilaria immitis]|nr:MAP kinase-activated protein kinase 2 [Dirofilaria immitis]
MNSITHRTNKFRIFRNKFTKGWKKARYALRGLYFHRLNKYEISMKQCLRATLVCVVPETQKICRLKIKSSSDSVKPIRDLISKLERKPTNELGRMKRKGDNWSANDFFKFQHGNFNHCDIDEKRAICVEWLRRLQNITKNIIILLGLYASAIYTCYYRLAPLIIDKEEKKRVWIDVKREYAEIFLMGRRIWRRPTHPTRLRILYDLAMLCVLFNDIPNDETVILFRDLLDDNDNFNFEVLNEIEYAQSIDKAVRLENHVIDLFYQRRKSTCSARSSFLSKSSNETPRSSFRSFRARNDYMKSGKLRKASSFSIPDNIISDSCLTTGILTSKVHKLPIKDTNADTTENMLTGKDEQLIIIVTNVHGEVINQRAFKQLFTSNVIFNGISDIDVEFAIEKKSNDAKTSRIFPSMLLTDSIRAFITTLLLCHEPITLFVTIAAISIGIVLLANPSLHRKTLLYKQFFEHYARVRSNNYILLYRIAIISWIAMHTILVITIITTVLATQLIRPELLYPQLLVLIILVGLYTFSLLAIITMNFIGSNIIWMTPFIISFFGFITLTNLYLIVLTHRYVADRREALQKY